MLMLPPAAKPVPVEEREAATVRLAGDAGDGIHLAGTQFSRTSALAGNLVRMLPEFPAEIRAPAGSLAGVSAYQIQFGRSNVLTPGDRLDVLVALNPAALRTNLADLQPGGLLIVDRDAFDEEERLKAGYAANPLEDTSLQTYRVAALPITTLNRSAVAAMRPTPREADRCRNFFALGLVYWLFERPLGPTLCWIQDKFARNVDVLEGNSRSLRAGYNYAETSGTVPMRYRVGPARVPPGRYRKVTGNEALALGLVSAAEVAGLPLLFAAAPTTPSSEVFHHLAAMKRFGVRTFQAEDEPAAVGSALGAAFAGGLGATATTGPGVALDAEAIGLGVMAELPLVVINVQRGGPSTGMPTKTEQADLLQALFGRNGECPAAVLAARSPADCFETVYEAARLAVAFMTPVIVLSDGYLANGAEPWRIPNRDDLPPIPVQYATASNADRAGRPVFLPYRRDSRLVREWAVPGTPGLEHRIGGLEKDSSTGDVSYEPANHEHMVRTRAQKVANISEAVPPLEVDGPASAELLVVGWGSTFGAIAAAVHQVRDEGRSIAQAHLRHLNPLPRDTGAVLKRYPRVLVPELNRGQLRHLLRAEFLVDVVGLNKVQGQAFTAEEIAQKIREMTKQ
jgi:2-oxoglutarate ferredoxin oxidoreductase subunit alpha